MGTGRFLFLAFIGFFAQTIPYPVGAADPGTIPVIDSAKEIEMRLSALLGKRMKLQSNLKIVNQDPNNLFVEVRFDKNTKAGSPEIVVLIDTTILSRDSKNVPVSQAISIVSTAEIGINAAKGRQKLLEWANTWNSKTFPIKIYISGGRIFVGATLVSTTITPLAEHRFQSAFTGTVQIWPVLTADLRKNGLIQK